MVKGIEPVGDEKVCMVCKSGSDEKVLLSALDKGKQAWVCVHCLPMLIHGAH